MKKVISISLMVFFMSVGFAGAYGGKTHKEGAVWGLDLFSHSPEFDGTYWNGMYEAYKEEDGHDHVYRLNGIFTTITHFWNADKGDDDRVGKNSPGAGEIQRDTMIESGNARQKAEILWGMALGRYNLGHKATAYELFGHVGHLIMDMTVPSHAHETAHADPLDLTDVLDDCYEGWMEGDETNRVLDTDEQYLIQGWGKIEVPAWEDDTAKLDYLLYTANQVGDVFADTWHSGDTDERTDKQGWMDFMYNDQPFNMSAIEIPTSPLHLAPNHIGDNDAFGNLSKIRENSYFHAIRSVAAMNDLIEETTKKQNALTVYIKHVKEEERDPYDPLFILGTNPLYFVEVTIGETWFVNRGDEMESFVGERFDPEWAFARAVGETTDYDDDDVDVNVEIKLIADGLPYSFDPRDCIEDNQPVPGCIPDNPRNILPIPNFYPGGGSKLDPNPGDYTTTVDINPDFDDRSLKLSVDLEKCMNLEDGAVTDKETGEILGKCGETLTSAGLDKSSGCIDDADDVYNACTSDCESVVDPVCKSGCSAVRETCKNVGCTAERGVCDGVCVVEHPISCWKTTCLERAGPICVVPGPPEWDYSCGCLSDCTDDYNSCNTGCNTVYNDCKNDCDTVLDSGCEGTCNGIRESIVTYCKGNPELNWHNATIKFKIIPPNAPPTVDAGVDQTIDDGGTFTSSGSFSDPNPEDTWTATVDYGDGSGPQPLTLTGKTFSLSHVYASDGVYTVTVNVTDEHGAVGTDTATVTVLNVAPYDLNLNSPEINESENATINGSFTDPGTLDVHTVNIDWGDGNSEIFNLPVGDRNFSKSHQYPDDNPSGTPSDDYSISVTVMDDDGGSDSASTTVTVNNVNPVASIDSIADGTGGGCVSIALVGFAVDMAGSFTDVGTQDTHTAVVDWGDSTVTDIGAVVATTNASHVYLAPGDYTITQTVIDDDTGVDATTAPIKVVDVAGAFQIVIEELIPLADDRNIAGALGKLRSNKGGKANNGALDMLEKDNLNAALKKIKQALQALEKTEVDSSCINSLLALAAKSVAVEAISQAEAGATKSNELRKIQQAKDLVAHGDTLLAASDFVGAVNKYQQVVRAL